MNATKLRAELYAVLDRVLDTGEPVIIERKGRRLRLSLEEARLPPRGRKWPAPRPQWVKGDVEELVHIDWSAEWRP